LNRDRLDGQKAGLLRWTSILIHLRKTNPTLGAGDANQLHHSVWALEREQVLILHRWSNRGDAALLLFGFNQLPVTLTLCEPVGTWQLRLDSGTAEFGGSEKEARPQDLVINAQGTALTIPAYSAAVYVLVE
jgi:hypothetical protein